jgi:hypothetical protein
MLQRVESRTVSPAREQNRARLPRVRIFSVLCPPRHGSTLVSLLLGNHSDVCALGDTLPQERLPRRCGCGEPFLECEFWQKVRAIAHGSGENFPAARPEYLPWAGLNQAATLAAGLSAIRVGTRLRFEPFSAMYDRYLGVCAEHRAFHTFIDGYKSVSRYVALKSGGFPVAGVIHVVRDPRAFAASEQRKGGDAIVAAKQWVRLHKGIERTVRFTGERVFALKYEDLCRDPHGELTRLQAWLELSPQPLLRPVGPGVHWIGSGSMRKFNGEVYFKEKWMEELSPEQKSRIENLTARLAGRYGYAFS